MTSWDPRQYERFQKERAQPFFDLLSRVPDGDVRNIADLGCGPGTLTATLTERWPWARVWGVDTSPAMLAVAENLPRRVGLRFVEADLGTWQPPQPLDLIVSNAVLHWVANHAGLLRRLVGRLAPRGVLAVQMPSNTDTPAQRFLREVVQDARWAAALADHTAHFHVRAPDWYADTLHGLGCRVQVWETIYHHRLAGEDAVLEWMKGTGLRPLLDRLDRCLGCAVRATFLEAYGRRLACAYPAGPHGTPFPFRRLFFVAQLREGGLPPVSKL